MSAIDNVLWWSGCLSWAFFGIIGIVWFVEAISDWLMGSIWSRKELTAFVWSRLQARKDRP